MLGGATQSLSFVVGMKKDTGEEKKTKGTYCLRQHARGILVIAGQEKIKKRGGKMASCRKIPELSSRKIGKKGAGSNGMRGILKQGKKTKKGERPP